jgi:hypothetical protein
MQQQQSQPMAFGGAPGGVFGAATTSNAAFSFGVMSDAPPPMKMARMEEVGVYSDALSNVSC